MNTIPELMEACDQIWDQVISSQDKDMQAALHLLYNRMEHPMAFVSLVGETSSGKSTIINSLLGETLLPIGARPTTGVVT
jgi:ribosome biogenesis GTPase A